MDNERKNEPIDYPNILDSDEEGGKCQVGETNMRKCRKLTSKQLEKQKEASGLWH